MNQSEKIKHIRKNLRFNGMAISRMLKCTLDELCEAEKDPSVLSFKSSERLNTVYSLLKKWKYKKLGPLFIHSERHIYGGKNLISALSKKIISKKQINETLDRLEPEAKEWCESSKKLFRDYSISKSVDMSDSLMLQCEKYWKVY